MFTTRAKARYLQENLGLHVCQQTTAFITKAEYYFYVLYTDTISRYFKKICYNNFQITFGFQNILIGVAKVSQNR